MSEGIPMADKNNTLSSKTRNKVNPMQEAGVLDSDGEQEQEPLAEEKTQGRLKQMCSCPPQGAIAKIITHVAIAALVWGLTWTLTGKDSLPGGKIFGMVVLYFSSVFGGRIIQLIKIPGLPPFPRLLVINEDQKRNQEDSSKTKQAHATSLEKWNFSLHGEPPSGLWV